MNLNDEHVIFFLEKKIYDDDAPPNNNVRILCVISINVLIIMYC